MRAQCLVIAVLTGLALSGCASSPPPLAPEPVGPYTLDSGDRLRVVVFGQDGLSNSYAVDPAGRIVMPLIGGVPARGLTTMEVSQSIAGKLKEGYVREPHVAVEVEIYRPFFVLGEVTTPGQFPYVPNLTVEDAVAMAGGFSPRARRGPVHLRHQGDGSPVGEAALSYPVRPGDTIVVAERWF